MTADSLQASDLSGLLLQAPALIGLLRGPLHELVVGNELYHEVISAQPSAAVRARLDRVLRSGEPLADRDTAVREHYFDVVYQPARNAAGHIDGVLVWGVDVTDQVLAREEARRAADRTARLLDVTAALSRARTRAEVADAVLQHGVAALGAAAGSVYVLSDENDPPTLKLIAYAAYGSGDMDDYRSFPLDAPVPNAVAARTGQAVWLESDAAWREQFAPVASVNRDIGFEAAAAIPLIVGGRTIGAVGLSFLGARTFSEDDRALILAVAGQSAQALERARLYDAVRASEQRIALAQAVGGIGTFEWDLETGQSTWTRELEMLYGLTPGGFTGGYDQWARALHPDDREQAEATVSTAVAEGRNYRTSFRVVWPNGEVRHIAAQGHILHDVDGKAARLVGVNVDVSEREQALERAEAAVRSRDEFLSIASHELRTPLSGLKGSAQLMQRLRDRGKLDDQRLERSITAMVDSANRLARLVDDLLDVSRLRMGLLEVRPASVELAALLRERAERVRVDAPRHVARLEIGCSDCVVQADADRIGQVIDNLIDNAVKYTPEGGVVVISLERSEGGVSISVADQGIGLPAGAEVTIFEPFERASNAREQHLPGMGLGLYVSRQIAEAHGGRLSASSAGEGKGSVFTLWLPA